MNKKPDRMTAMQNIIDAVKAEFPIYQEDTFKCNPNNSCTTCTKKLMELVDTEIVYWEHEINRGSTPTFDELNRFGKMCKNIRRALVKDNRII